MPILPIDSGRYGSPEIRAIFEEENKLRKMLEVEAALAWAHAQVGNIPKEAAERIEEAVRSGKVRLERVKEIEREIKHDVMAVVKALAEACGEYGGYVHLGATSNDITDTATALQLKEALAILERKLVQVEQILMELAFKYRDLVMVGRTHGQHALPITFGLKVAVWVREVARHLKRFEECRKRVLVGKMTGAVGTQAGFGPHAREIQRKVMERLGLGTPLVTTQILQRDRYAELVFVLALICSTFEKIATEIRNLQRTEIGEVFEPFGKKQVGSSTMPHKRNPILCERICGLAKLVRSLVHPALENVTTWHERDLTQSSCERFLIPEAVILTDEVLNLAIKVLSGLEVDKEAMERNLRLTRGAIMSEAIMIKLVEKGMGRQEAHELLRQIAVRCREKKEPFDEAVMRDEVIRKYLSEEEIREALDPRNYLGTALEQVEETVKKTKEELKEIGFN